MKPCRKKTTIILVLAMFSLLMIPVNARAESPISAICHDYCGQNRELYLSNPPMAGDDVKGLQEMLHSLGYYNDACNGIFNHKTDQALRRFQKDSGLAVDGRVRENTWDMLSKAVEKPVVAKVEPPPEGKKVIVIDTMKRTLTLLNNGEPFRQFPVAVGKPETPTPVGTWHIKRKATNWGTGFGTRWMGLNVTWGIYGIHGTNKPYSIGGYQSHGCIRMFNRHVEQLYRWVPVNTPVIIVGNPLAYMDPPYKIMRRGDRGSAVMEVQSALQRLGYEIDVDGIWGYGMEKVIIQYRKDAGLPFDNAVDRAVYKSLGFQ